MTEWQTPFKQPDTRKNGYFFAPSKGIFSCVHEDTNSAVYHFFSDLDRKFYNINFETNECREIEKKFDVDELYKNEPGFQECSEKLQYACMENAFNSLPSFLDGKIAGNQFDRDRAIRAYEKIAANNDGTSGEKIYWYVFNRLSE